MRALPEPWPIEDCESLSPDALADLVNDPEYPIIAGFVKGVDEAGLEEYLRDRGVTLTEVGAIPTALLEDD